MFASVLLLSSTLKQRQTWHWVHCNIKYKYNELALRCIVIYSTSRASFFFFEVEERCMRHSWYSACVFNPVHSKASLKYSPGNQLIPPTGPPSTARLPLSPSWSFTCNNAPASELHETRHKNNCHSRHHGKPHISVSLRTKASLFIRRAQLLQTDDYENNNQTQKKYEATRRAQRDALYTRVVL